MALDSGASVVVPVYNDPEGVRSSLDSILEHTGTDQLAEIVVVDNDSTDETPAVVSEYAADSELVTLARETEIQSSYAARNTGIEQAEGDVLVFLDADVTVTEGWLETALDRLDTLDAHYLAPDVELGPPEPPTLAARYNHTTGFPIQDFIEQHNYAPTACLFVRRELIDEVGPFDERLVSGGDLEFGNRVYEAGYDLHYAPEITVSHPVRTSLPSLFRRNVRIGRGHCQLQRYHPERYGRVGIPPRPSGIRGQQYEGVKSRLTFGPVDLAMTATRGLGYYRECVSTLVR